MPDRENYIEVLSKTVKTVKESSEDAPIQISLECIEDILELLKEQEVKPTAIKRDIEGIWATCSMCGHKLRPILAMKRDTYIPKFCSECGQAVKWE